MANQDLSNTRAQQVFADAIKKEDRLRMKWFSKNEQRLLEYVEKPPAKKVDEKVIEQMVHERQERYRNVERHVRPKEEEEPPPLVDPRAISHIMKPVDPEVRKLLYTGTQRDGRINYLKERMEIIPENKYYFQETTSFVYGWKMWDESKRAGGKRFGRARIIQDSFYRKNGVARDPDWYQEPCKSSPTVCNA